MTFELREVKILHPSKICGLTCLWDRGNTYRVVKQKYTKLFKSSIFRNNFSYITVAGTYRTAR